MVLPGDITAAAISGTDPLNGWVLELTVEGWAGKTVSAIDLGWTAPSNQRGNDPTTDTPKCVVGLTSQGFNADGTTTTRSRTLYGTKRIRQAHPNQALFDTTDSGGNLIVRIALSDYVFAPDTAITVTAFAGLVTATDASTSKAVTGLAVTNNSTKAYPKVKAAWVDRASTLPGTRLGSTYAGAAFAAHAYGVASVCFEVYSAEDDGATAALQYVTEQVSLECERTASGTVPRISAYQANLDISGVEPGQGWAHVRAYPLIGDASSVFDSRDFGEWVQWWNDGTWGGGAQRAELQSRRHTIRSETVWPDVYVYVDTANGNNSTCVASEDAATARANPAAHTWDALKKARDYINATFFRSNNANGIRVRLMDNAGSDQDFEWGRTGFASTMDARWLGVVFEPDPLNTATVRFRTDNSTSNNYLLAGVTILSNLIVAPVAGDQSNYIGRATAPDWYVLDRCSLISESTSTGAPLFQSDVANVTRYCCRNESWYSSGAWGGVFIESVNYHGKVAANGGFAMGWKLDAHPTNGNWSEQPAISNSVAIAHVVLAFFELSTLTEPAFTMVSDQTGCFYGHAIIRRYSGAVAGSSGTQPLVDMITTPMSDCLLEHLTVVGGRFNLQNQELPNRIQERVYLRNSFVHYLAVKADTFASDGTLTGGWPVLWGVAQSGNYNGEADTFLQEFEGLRAWSRVASVGTRDQGLEDPDFDVTPATSSQVLGLPLESFAAFDIEGTAIGAEPDSGAIQVAAGGGGGGGGGVVACGCVAPALPANAVPRVHQMHAEDIGRDHWQ